MTFTQPAASGPITAIVKLPSNEIAAGALVPAALWSSLVRLQVAQSHMQVVI